MAGVAALLQTPVDNLPPDPEPLPGLSSRDGVDKQLFQVPGQSFTPPHRRSRRICPDYVAEQPKRAAFADWLLMQATGHRRES